MITIKTKFIIIGTAKLTVDIISYFKKLKIKVTVYEKSISKLSLVGNFCEKWDIQYFNFSTEQMTKQLLCDLEKYHLKVVSAVNTYIFPDYVVTHKNFEGINYHNSLLPDYKGMNAEAWCIFNMEDMTGITWHKISSGLDEGGIIAQEKLRINDSITSIKLLKIQSELGYKVFKEFASMFIKGKEIRIIKKSKLGGQIYKTTDIPNAGVLDLRWDFGQTSAFLRAMDYGKLNVLGKPILVIGTNTYVWRRYRFIEEAESENTYAEIKGKDIVLHKKGTNKKIYLLDIHEKKEGV